MGNQERLAPRGLRVSKGQEATRAPRETKVCRDRKEKREPREIGVLMVTWDCVVSQANKATRDPRDLLDPQDREGVRDPQDRRGNPSGDQRVTAEKRVPQELACQERKESEARSDLRDHLVKLCTWITSRLFHWRFLERRASQGLMEHQASLAHRARKERWVCLVQLDPLVVKGRRERWVCLVQSVPQGFRGRRERGGYRARMACLEPTVKTVSPVSQEPRETEEWWGPQDLQEKLLCWTAWAVWGFKDPRASQESLDQQGPVASEDQWERWACLGSGAGLVFAAERETKACKAGLVSVCLDVKVTSDPQDLQVLQGQVGVCWALGKRVIRVTEATWDLWDSPGPQDPRHKWITDLNLEPKKVKKVPKVTRVQRESQAGTLYLLPLELRAPLVPRAHQVDQQKSSTGPKGSMTFKVHLAPQALKVHLADKALLVPKASQEKASKVPEDQQVVKATLALQVRSVSASWDQWDPPDHQAPCHVPQTATDVKDPLVPPDRRALQAQPTAPQTRSSGLVTLWGREALGELLSIKPWIFFWSLLETSLLVCLLTPWTVTSFTSG